MNTATLLETSTIDAPSAALAIIDTMADDLLFTPGAVTDAQLAAGREWYLTEAKKYDISTEKARTELKRFARPLQKLRTGIEARAKELTGATKRKIAAIDAEKRRLVQIVGGIEQEVLASLTAYEAAEEARIETRNAAIKEIQSWGNQAADWMGWPSVQSMRDKIQEIESDTREWPELGELVPRYRAESIRLIKEAIAKRETYDAQQAELARLRAEAAERAEKDRLAEVAKQAVEAAKATIREEVIAELESKTHNDPNSDSNQGHGEPLNVQPFVYPAVTVSKVSVENEIIRALMENTEANHGVAMSVVEAIAKGLIPHVTIAY